MFSVVFLGFFSYASVSLLYILKLILAVWDFSRETMLYLYKVKTNTCPWNLCKLYTKQSMDCYYLFIIHIHVINTVVSLVTLLDYIELHIINMYIYTLVHLHTCTCAWYLLLISGCPPFVFEGANHIHVPLPPCLYIFKPYIYTCNIISVII